MAGEWPVESGAVIGSGHGLIAGANSQRTIPAINPLISGASPAEASDSSHAPVFPLPPGGLSDIPVVRQEAIRGIPLACPENPDTPGSPRGLASLLLTMLTVFFTQI